jgi:hypothetical protein
MSYPERRKPKPLETGASSRNRFITLCWMPPKKAMTYASPEL